MPNEDNPITIYGGVSTGPIDTAGRSGGLGGFFGALGRGLKKVAEVGWDAVKIIGEHADELFPEHYSAYERYQRPSGADMLFQGDDYLRDNVFNHPKNRDIMNKLANGDLLTDDEIKQTDLIIRLLEARADTEPKRFAAQSFRTNALQAIVGNQLLHSPVENGKVNYRGNWVEEYQAPYLVKSDIHSLLEKDRRMSLPEIKEWPRLHLPKTKQNTYQKLYNEPGAPDITFEVVSGLYGGAQLAKGLFAASRHAIGNYAKKQAAKRIIRFSSAQLQRKYKHAIRFGLSKNYNSQNAARFARILE